VCRKEASVRFARAIQERASMEAESAKQLAQVELEAGRREARWRERLAAAEEAARDVRSEMERRLSSLAHKLARAAKREAKLKQQQGCPDPLACCKWEAAADKKTCSLSVVQLRRGLPALRTVQASA
jgi:hypothetical protein